MCFVSLVVGSFQPNNTHSPTRVVSPDLCSSKLLYKIRTEERFHLFKIGTAIGVLMIILFAVAVVTRAAGTRARARAAACLRLPFHFMRERLHLINVEAIT